MTGIDSNMKRYINTTEAMEYLTISRSTLLRYVAANEIPFHRIGGRLIFNTEELDEWIGSGESAVVLERR